MKSQNKSICLLLIIAGFFLTESAIAQAEPTEYKIYGTIADSTTQKPLTNVTVCLMVDSFTTVKTDITKADGSFLFLSLKPLKYVIAISAANSITKTMVIHFTDSINNSADLGIIYISNKVNTLKEVVVTASQPVIKQDIDRITYDLQADPESKVNSVWEMMRKVPFLSIDGNDNILLKGSLSYKILINGKPSSLVERAPKDILRSMPASTIKSIEVIINPSSKYDAEGLAGIINIVTHKKIGNGYNGAINVNQKYPVGGPGAGGSFSVKQGKFGMSASGGAGIYNSPQTKSSTGRMTTGIKATNLDQNSTRETANKSAYFGSEVSYELDSLNLISAQININSSRLNSSGNQSSILNGSGRLQHYNLTNTNEGTGTGMDAALNYQLGFKSGKERLLTFSYRYLAYTNNQFTSLAVSNPVNYINPDYNQMNNGNSSEQTFQVDYVHSVKNLNIEAGIKAILRKNKSDFQYRSLNVTNGKFELDSTRTDKFNNDQNVFAAYNTYQYTLNNWGFKVGLRIEQTIVDADFIIGTAQVKQDYVTVIPSVSINRKFENRSSLSLGFTNRIQRPGIYQLNPFVDRSNPNFESAGNPNLKPGFANIIQVSYNTSQKASVNIALGYMLFNRLIGPVSKYDPATDRTRTTFENIGKARVLKTNFYLNYPITKKWNVRLNSDVRYVSSTVIINAVPVRNAGLMAYMNISSGYRFNKGWRLNTEVTANSGGVSNVQGKSNGFTGSSFGVQKDMVEDKLTFSASVGNPFTKYRRTREKVLGPDFTQVSVNHSYYRSFNVSLNYRFGKLKEAIKKNRRGISHDDVSN